MAKLGPVSFVIPGNCCYIKYGPALSNTFFLTGQKRNGVKAHIVDSLTVPGTFDSLGPIRDYVRAAAEKANLQPDTVYGLTLAVDELATNSITHGYQEHEMQGPLTVSIEITDKEFVVRLEDKAPAFDPCKLTVPSEEELSKPISERPVGGLGVYLTVKSIDRFGYTREGNSNCVIMAVNREPLPETKKY